MIDLTWVTGVVHGHLPGDQFNPWNGVTPDLGPFGTLTAWKVALGVVWAGAFIYSAFRGISAVVCLMRAHRNRYSEGWAQALEDLQKWAIGLVALVAMPGLWVAVALLGKGGAG